MSSNELLGKTALVSGGSKGIGLACTQSLAAAGANVAITARHAGDLDAARDALRAANPGAGWVTGQSFSADGGQEQG